VGAKANQTLTGQGITSALGSVIVHENEVINMPTFAVTSSLGSVSTIAKANVTPTGVAATASVATVLIYGEIDTSQTPSYSEIATSQTPNYTTIKGGRDAA
jgi:hypothetical protein